MENFKVKTKKVDIKNFLGIRDVVSDVKTLPNKFIVFMIIACVIIIFFNFFNVQGAQDGYYFLPLSEYHGVIHGGIASVFGNDQSGAVATAVLYSLNGIASFTGIIAVSLIAFNKSTQYFWGVINAIFFGLFAISVGYLGDLIMQAIIIICCPLGWYLFEMTKQNPNHDKKRNWKFNLVFFIGVILTITIIVLVLYEFLPAAFNDTFGKLPNAVNPYLGETNSRDNPLATRVLDSMGNGFNFVGYIMQLVNFNEQMYIWVFNDTIKLLKFTGISGSNSLSINMLIQFAVWISLDVIGIYNRLFREWIDELWIKIKKSI